MVDLTKWERTNTPYKVNEDVIKARKELYVYSMENMGKIPKIDIIYPFIEACNDYNLMSLGRS